MANEQHLAMLLRGGVSAWNAWRKGHPRIARPDVIVADLSGADLTGANLHGADFGQVDFSRANLHGADLSGANLCEALLIEADAIGAKFIKANLSDALLDKANLREADFESADLHGAYLREANLREANLNQANLGGADFERADLREAKLIGARAGGAIFYEADLRDADLSQAGLYRADLSEAILVRTNLSHANLSDCIVYGITAWDVNLDSATQINLRITSLFTWEPVIVTVDNLEVARFLSLLVHNQNAREVFDTFTSKFVLILGGFGRFGDRNANLSALCEALRNHPNGYIPVIFDFNPQVKNPAIGSVKVLANLARFVVSDLTDPNVAHSVLPHILANESTVPVQSLIEADASLPDEYSIWQTYHSFLPVYRYATFDQVLANLTSHVIEPVEDHVHARHLFDDHGK